MHPIGTIDLGQDVLHVRFDRGQRDEKLLGNLGIAQPLGYQLGNFMFALAKLI